MQQKTLTTRAAAQFTSTHKNRDKPLHTNTTTTTTTTATTTRQAARIQLNTDFYLVYKQGWCYKQLRDCPRQQISVLPAHESAT